MKRARAVGAGRSGSATEIGDIPKSATASKQRAGQGGIAEFPESGIGNGSSGERSIEPFAEPGGPESLAQKNPILEKKNLAVPKTSLDSRRNAKTKFDIKSGVGMALAAFVALAAVYHLNGDFLPGNDAKPSVYLPFNLIHRKSFSFAPLETPSMFKWEFAQSDGKRRLVNIDNLEVLLDGKTGRARLADGTLIFRGPRYYLVPALKCGDCEQRYISTFGPGAGLSALPFFAALELIKPSAGNATNIWYASKTVASLMVAGSAAFLFLSTLLISRAYQGFYSRQKNEALRVGGKNSVEKRNTKIAFLVTGAYGLGTCVWSISSQALWQHGPAEFFLSLGIYFYLKSIYDVPLQDCKSGSENRANADFGSSNCSKFNLPVRFASGFGLGFAVVCRPTCVFFAAAIAFALGLELVLQNIRYFKSDYKVGSQIRRDICSFLAFLLGTAIPGAGLAVYNNYYLGSSFRFGQTEIGRSLALEKTGSPDAWQTPIWEGLAGLLVSPSRGLFIFSPFLVFSIVGAVAIWRKTELRSLRPIVVATCAILLIESKHFDWWGGWSYGYRHIVDLVVPLSLFLVPAVPAILISRRYFTCFGLLLAWSIAVQIAGAWAYDLRGWNSKLLGFQVELPGGGITTVPTIAEARRIANDTKGRLVGELRADIDKPQYRSRLWSFGDSEPLYYLLHFSESRKSKQAILSDFR